MMNFHFTGAPKASTGVMRANDDHDFDAAFDQMRVGSEAVAPTLQKFVSILIRFEKNNLMRIVL